ncbi:NUDIX hydrolase [Tengunoibacter tsumagoiensis]|uniref:Nudix hydrolase domain-containing protein n=1 Tax=Tengunoibacter tsumagoiensis TaxID=2014871 RepID=A0A401ZVJ1_9CHLR|nr:NUDIX hydrolase [Tengunoibacter tsumagoiensis]GCE10867.1 hypothetical protein KTT_07260 [Tengunoibacter tsumagoiensis]
MLYDLLKKCVSLFFNLLNRILGGKLPPFGSAAIVVEEQDLYLIVKLPGERVVFPGGFMNWNEDPRQGAEREGFEETGLHIRAGELINYYSLASSSFSNMSTLSFVFEGSVIGGELKSNAEGQPGWMTEDQLRRSMDRHSIGILEEYLRLRARNAARPTMKLVS